MVERVEGEEENSDDNNVVNRKASEDNQDVAKRGQHRKRLASTEKANQKEITRKMEENDEKEGRKKEETIPDGPTKPWRVCVVSCGSCACVFEIALVSMDHSDRFLRRCGMCSLVDTIRDTDMSDNYDIESDHDYDEYHAVSGGLESPYYCRLVYQRRRGGARRKKRRRRSSPEGRRFGQTRHEYQDLQHRRRQQSTDDSMLRTPIRKAQHGSSGSNDARKVVQV